MNCLYKFIYLKSKGTYEIKFGELLSRKCFYFKKSRQD